MQRGRIWKAVVLALVGAGSVLAWVLADLRVELAAPHEAVTSVGGDAAPERVTGGASVAPAPAGVRAHAPAAAPVRQVWEPGGGGASRDVRLRFECATVWANGSEGLWKTMELAVELRAPGAALLAVCTEPWQAAPVRLPVGMGRVDVAARGYERETVDLSRCARDADGAAVVVLTPAASLAVRARGLPAGDHVQLGIGFPVRMGTQGVEHFVGLGGSRRIAPADAGGRLEVQARVPSGLRLEARLGSGVGWISADASFVTQVRPVAPLADGERRVVEIDVGALPVLRGRVVGLPLGAGAGQLIQLHQQLHQPGAGALGVSYVRTSGDGEFALRGLSAGPVELRLQVLGVAPVLRRVGDGARSFAPDESFLVVEPDGPLVGVVPVENGAIIDRPFGVGAYRPSRLDSRVRLFTPEWLKAGTVCFSVQGTGEFFRRLADRQPGPDGLIRVEVPAPGGEVVVKADGPLEEWRFALEIAVPGERSTWIQPDEKAEGMRHFAGVPPGEHRLAVGRRHSAGVNLTLNTVVRSVTVRSGARTEVRVELPRVVEATAVVTGHRPWIEAYGALNLSLFVGRLPYGVALPESGEVAITVLEGWAGPARITAGNKRLYPRLTIDDHRWDPQQRRLEIRFPQRVQGSVLEAASVAGGGLWMRVYGGADRTDTGVDVLPATAGRFELQHSEEPIDVLLMENAFDGDVQLKVVRGWLRIPAGARVEREFSPSGRWVKVRRGAEGTSELRVLAPEWWQHPGYAWATRRLEGVGPHHVWIPEGARGLRIDGREVLAAAIDAELELR